MPDVTAELVCNGEKAGTNHFAAFILIDDDKGFPHGLLVGERIGDHDRFLAEETMTAADIATLDVSKFHRDDLLVTEGIHLRDDRCRLSVFCMLRLPVD